MAFLYLLQEKATCTSAGIMKAAKNDEEQWHFFLILNIFVFSTMWVGETSSHATIVVSKQSAFL